MSEELLKHHRAVIGDAILQAAKKFRAIPMQSDEYWAKLADAAIAKYESLKQERRSQEEEPEQ